MAEVGLIPDRNVELLNGEIIDMPPIGPDHADAVSFINRLLVNAFPYAIVRPQNPFDAGPDSEPQPDLVVIDARDRVPGVHPKSALLVVEVADSSLAYDRTRKASRYAASGIADYWIVNLVDRQLEVYRDPQPMADQEFGHGYASRTIVPVDGQVSPLVAPQVVLAVKEMLP
jgi:Uma2 family endonuclease